MNTTTALPESSAAPTNPPPSGFAPRHPWDRNAFLAFVALIWVGILSGFVPEMIDHVVQDEPPYPWIVHVHAVVFVGWLALLTAQVLLIRANRASVHRRLGVFGAALAAVMVVVGPAAALITAAGHFAQSGKAPIFLSVQLTDILAFAGLAVAGLALRAKAPAHKRLILLATIYISDAGFARWLGIPLLARLGDAPAALFLALYLPNGLALALGAYDLVTRGRLHPAYVGGVLWMLANQMLALSLFVSAAWVPVSLFLIGRH